MRYLIIAVLLSSCTTGNWLFSNIKFFGYGNEEGTTTTINAEQVSKIHQEGNRLLTGKEVEAVKKAFDQGIGLANLRIADRNRSLEDPLPADEGDDAPEKPKIDYQAITEAFLAKNKKAEGINPQLLLILAVAYDLFKDWTVFEGMRTRERQKKLVDRGVSWTMNSKHLTGRAADILGKDKKGKFSFDAVDDLNMARGVIFGVYLDLLGQGIICVEWERVLRWTKVRDLYHIQINIPDGCDANVYIPNPLPS